MKPDEHGFEDAIEASLLTEGGYSQSLPSHFDAAVGLDTAELFAFIGATQVRVWNQLLARYGNDPDAAQRGFVRRLAKDLDDRGTLEVLRHGVVDLGVELRLAFFKPAHGLTPELVERYRANRVTVTRQLPYDADSGKTVDLGLFVNGILVATAELKNPITGQTVEHAIFQYRRDRDPRNVTLGEVPAVQPWTRPAQGEPPESDRAPHVVLVGTRLAAGQLAGPARPVHARRASGKGDCRPEARCRDGHLPPVPPVGCRSCSRSSCSGTRRW